jgi:hypothetical protein
MECLVFRITAMKMTRLLQSPSFNSRCTFFVFAQIRHHPCWPFTCTGRREVYQLQSSRFAAEPEIARQVLSYFVRNTQAADTLEGIARWRLVEEQLQNSLHQTDAAITWLVEQGYLEVVQPVGSVRLYRLDPLRQKDALHFLSQQKAPRSNKKQ